MSYSVCYLMLCVGVLTGAVCAPALARNLRHWVRDPQDRVVVTAVLVCAMLALPAIL